MEQKFLITNSQRIIQDEIDNGWRVESVTATMDCGRVAVVLERSKNKDMSEKLLKSKLVQPKHDSPFVS
jgi:ABC-type thiamine transport system substrate-binding protein